MIDLQLHSTFSDGSFSPTELVRKAKDLGLTAISLTDHDTVDGIPEFLEAGKTYQVTTVPGVEISVDTSLPNNGHMHILGLFIDPFSRKLKNTLDFLLTQRNLRAEKIVERLEQLNLPVSGEELLAEAGEGAIGRPHLAKIMVRKGYVKDISEAFEKYLKKGGPAYIDKVKLGEADALRMIKESGGLAILAHPHLMRYDTMVDTRNKILALAEMGLDGFEVFYPGIPEETTRDLLELARDHDFAISGGSDFHGLNRDGVKMGTGTGDLAVPDEIYFQLKKRWETTI
jgi:predicted metal-dependent phosphoesterase TrpH